ncbi:MAG: peptidylprolyl isomerase [Sphingomonas sp. 28-66-16]|nr:MAG: peptidylprolyl isomerase [Sphingomonas sp. 28-66-16]
MRRPIIVLLAFLSSITVAASPASKAPAGAGMVRVRLVTAAGDIVVALDTRRAPRTSANFLAYVDDGRLDGTGFYRAVHAKSDPKRGFIQGGIDTQARRMLPSVPLEPTDRTGIRHLDATISMAHGDNPDSATGNFSITVGAAPALDAQGSYRGYAAFGHVVAGMDVVRRIMALPTGGGRGVMRGQMILAPVKLIRAIRLDGTPHPTGRVKPWLIELPPRR